MATSGDEDGKLAVMNQGYLWCNELNQKIPMPGITYLGCSYYCMYDF